MDYDRTTHEMPTTFSDKYLTDAKHCEDVDSWYCEDFILDMYAESDWDNYPDIRDEIMALLKGFAVKYDPLNEPDDPFEDQIYVGNCPVIKNEELPEFVEVLEKVLSLAGEANASVNLEAEFTSDSGYPFAALVLELEKGFTITRKYYRA